jgi:hypothetical protein
LKEQFINKNFSPESVADIVRANQIIDEYQAAGFRLTIRQLYYQMVSRDMIPNNEKSYKRIVNLISDGRQAGLIDWEMIEDRGRVLHSSSHWDSPRDVLYSAASSYRIDKWARQPWYIEVMVEKDALSGVIGPVCRRLDIAYTANKGYSSSSAMYEAGKRLAEKFYDGGKNIMVSYLGDHDPSGIDMTRDITERLMLYASLEKSIHVERIALNYDQVERLRPPENPAKTTDSRAAAYIKKFGRSSWELDAIEPRELADLIEYEVVNVMDEDLWDEAVEEEKYEREKLRLLADRYV